MRELFNLKYCSLSFSKRLLAFSLKWYSSKQRSLVLRLQKVLQSFSHHFNIWRITVNAGNPQICVFNSTERHIRRLQNIRVRFGSSPLACLQIPWRHALFRPNLRHHIKTLTPMCDDSSSQTFKRMKVFFFFLFGGLGDIPLLLLF